MADIVTVFATVAGPPEREYLMFENAIEGKTTLGNKQTHGLKQGDRYLVTLRISKRKKVRRIVTLDKVLAPTTASVLQAGSNSAQAHAFAPIDGADEIFAPPQEDAIYHLPSDVDETLTKVRAAYSGRNANIFILGPQGVGKTTLARQIAARWKYHYYEFNCAQVREPMDWIGRPNVRDGQIIFVPTLLMSAISTPRSIVCFNEWNRVRTVQHNALYELLSDARKAWFEELGAEVRVAQDVIFMFTMNVGHGNTGTFIIDDAMWDRADLVVELTWLEQAVEETILVKATGIEPTIARQICSIAKEFRARWQTGTLPVAPSLRWMLAAATLIAKGKMKYDKAMDVSFVNHYSDEGFPNSFRATARTILRGKGVI